MLYEAAIILQSYAGTVEHIFDFIYRMMNDDEDIIDLKCNEPNMAHRSSAIHAVARTVSDVNQQKTYWKDSRILS